jgi:site-specific DNA-cytosine methylase
MDNGKPRKFTEIEYERLQGLPDNFTNIQLNGRQLSYSKRCSLCGNAWTLPVIEHIFKGIK